MVGYDLGLLVVAPRAASGPPLDLDFVQGRYRRGAESAAGFVMLSGIGFSRSGAGVAPRLNGALAAFATGAPRITDRGLLLEGAATNLLLNSTWAGGNTPTSWTLAATSNAPSSRLSSVQALTFTTAASRIFTVQSVMVAASTTYTVSVEIEAVSGAVAAQQILASGSAVSATLAYPACSANPAGGGGSAVATGRLVMIYTVNASGGSEQFRFGNGASNTSTGSVTLSLPQIEPGSVATSPIVTTGAVVTRGADAASVTVPAGVSTWTATHGVSNTVVGGAVTPGATFDLVAGRPWIGLGSELKRLVMG